MTKQDRPAPAVNSMRRSSPKVVGPEVGTNSLPLLELKFGEFVRAFLSESAAFKVCCVYLLFEYVRPQSIYTWLDIVPFAQLSLIVGLALATGERSRDRKPVYGSQWPLLTTFLLTALVSILLAKYPSAGWPVLKVVVAWLIAIYVITCSVVTERRFVIFYVLFLLFSFKMSQHGFRSWAGSDFSFQRTGVTGAPGWFQNSGEVGIQMCIFLPMMVHFMAAGWARWGHVKRALVCIVPITILGTIIGSSSRGAVAGALAALMWMLLVGRRHRFGIVLGMLAVVIGGYLVLPAEFLARFYEIGKDSNSINRLQYWSFGWEIAKSYPFFGIGLGNWLPVYRDHVVTIGSMGPIQLPHNIFVEAVAGLGFVGLGLVLLIMISTFRLNYKTRRLAMRVENGFLRHAALGLDAGMVGFLVSAQFVTVLFYPYLWIALALTIALHNVAHRMTMPVAATVGWVGNPASRINRVNDSGKVKIAAP